MEDRISGLKDIKEMDIKEKTEEFLDKTQELQKEYKRTQQFYQKTKPVTHGH
jgi:hypothetical protein